MTVEYRIKVAKRYIVTRAELGDGTGSVTERGTYDNTDVAYEVATALCKMEHDKSGDPPDSVNFIYPKEPKASHGTLWQPQPD